MIQYKTGNILKEDAEALVNTVNCVGVMGRGIALQFKKNFPENFDKYKEACQRKKVKPGQMFVIATGQTANPRYIINFPTKRHWRGMSRMKDIEDGLEALVEEICKHNIRSVAIPPLGSGLGGLDWNDVRLRMERYLGKLSEKVLVTIFEPDGVPGSKAVRSKKVPRMTSGRAALIGLMDRYLRSGLLEPFVTLLEIHKLMYFMQCVGEPLKLSYTKGSYGPYAENLRHVLNAIDGHYISGYADGGDLPHKEIELIPGSVEDANRYLEAHPETRSRFDKVAELIAGFETPFGLELLSTVHWTIVNTEAKHVADVVKGVYAWGKRKRQFTPNQIEIAIRALSSKGWVDSAVY